MKTKNYLFLHQLSTELPIRGGKELIEYLINTLKLYAIDYSKMVWLFITKVFIEFRWKKVGRKEELKFFNHRRSFELKYHKLYESTSPVNSSLSVVNIFSPTKEG